MMELRIDEEFRDILPKLSDDEYKRLEGSIVNNGYDEAHPIIVWGDTIIDGHNRYEICTKHGIQFTTTFKDFKDRKDAIVYIITKQLGQRNLTDFQKVEIISKYEGPVKEAARERQANSTGGANPQLKEISSEAGKGQTRDILGAMAGMSGFTYDRAKRTMENGRKEIVDAARDGEIAINTAYNTTKMSQDMQDEIVADIKSGISAKDAIAKAREKSWEEEKKEEKEEMQTATIDGNVKKMYDQKDFQVGSHDIKDWAVELQASTNTYISSIRMHFLRLQDYIVTKAEKKDIRDALDRIINVLNQLKGEYK